MDFRRIDNLPPYVFAEVNERKSAARRAGVDVIDLGFGNPDIPSPDGVVDKLVEAATQGKNHRYSASRGIPNLRKAVADAVTRRSVSWNPVSATTPPRVERDGGQAFSAEEVQQLLAAADSPRLRALVGVACTAGLRLGELAALRWQHVDVNAGTVRVERTIRWVHGGVRGWIRAMRRGTTLTS